MKQGKLNNCGATLGEMMVVCLIVGLISVLAAQTLVFSYRMTAEISADAYAAEVSEIILNQVSGVISKAKTVNGSKICISEDKSIIAFENADARPVIIYTSDREGLIPEYSADTFDDEIKPLYKDIYSGKGYLNIYYGQIREEDRESAASLWTFDEKTYMGYEIVSLFFTPVTRQDKLSVLIELTIKRTDGIGEAFSRSITVCCYNIDDISMYEKFESNGRDFIWNYLKGIWSIREKK